MAYIRYDPNKPGDREEACIMYAISVIAICGSFGGSICYIYWLIHLLKGNYSENFLYSLIMVAIIAIIDFIAFFPKKNRKQRAKTAKKFFLLFISGILVLSGTIGVIVAITSLCNDGTGLILFLCCLLEILTIVLISILLYRKNEGIGPIKLYINKEKLFEINNLTDSVSVSQATISSQANNIAGTVEQSIFEQGFLFCHKCGKKLPSDSAFCSSCGTAIK